MATATGRGSSAPDIEAVPSLPIAERVQHIAHVLRHEVAGMLEMQPDDVPLDEPLVGLGINSLQTLQIKQKLEAGLNVSLALTSLLESPTLVELARLVSESLGHVESMAQEDAPARPGRSVTDEHLPASHGQEALWYSHLAAPHAATYNVSLAARITGPLDVERLRRCFDALAERHAALRVTFAVHGGSLVQRVHGSFAQDFRLELLSGRQRLSERLADEARRPFDLSRGPLFRVRLFRLAPDEHALLLCVHHSVVDFWSLTLLAQELGALYAGDRLPPLSLSFAEATLRQRRQAETPEAARQRAYWLRQLAGELPVLELPLDHTRPAIATNAQARVSFRIESELTGRLKRLARAHQSTLFALLLAAYQTLLHRHGGQDDIIVGVPASARGRPDLAGQVGYFANPLAIRTRFRPEEPFATLLTRVRETLIGGLANQDLPFPLIVSTLGAPRDASRAPVFQAMFVMHQALQAEGRSWGAFAAGIEGPETAIGPLTATALEIEPQPAPYDITLTATEIQGELACSLVFNPGLFDRATMERMAGHFKMLLEGIASDPSQSVSRLPLLTPEERKTLLHDWNATASPVPDVCTHELFQAQAQRTPDAVALICDGRQMTYRELDERSSQLAHHLQRLGVGPDVTAGICFERSFELAIGLLGVLKAGGANVPLEPTYPAGRLAAIIADAKPAVILTQASLAHRLPGGGGIPTLRLDLDGAILDTYPTRRPIHGATPANLAFGIYTSGSTGTPKGVAVPHRAVVNFLTWDTRTHPITSASVMPVHMSIAFDAGLIPLLTPLIAGRSALLLRDEPACERLAGVLNAGTAVHLLRLTPSHLRLLTASTRPETARLIDTLILGGETVFGEALAGWAESAPRMTVFNEYGPTETTVGCISYRTTAGSLPAGRVPIGRPIDNTRAYVLDAHREPVPIGVPGELYIGGAGLASGYLNRPDLTRQRFLPDPLVPGERMYRTGDRARYLPDGNIEYLGRLDRQIKLRGFRIELEEIEAVLGRHPGVRAAAVVVSATASGETLVGYIVPAADALDTAEVRSYVRRRLPEYMTPSWLVTIPALPLTANGKLDTSALPAPPRAEQRRPGEDGAPRDALERQLAAILGKTLGLPAGAIGRNGSFFDLGGHSLLAVRLLARIEEELGKRPSLVDFLQAPTVAGLARQLRAPGSGARAAGGGHAMPAVLRMPRTRGRSRGSRAPLFIATASYGNLPSLSQLGDLLKPEHPLYSLQPPGRGDAADSFDTVGHLAEVYMAAILDMEPRGPYVLGGYSIGGLAAFETALRLVAAGHEAPLVLLVDTPFPIGTSQSASFQRLLRSVPKRLLPLPLEQWSHDAVVAEQLRAAEGCRPGPYSGRVALFSSSEFALPGNVSAGRWRKLALGGFSEIRVPGRHDSMLRPPHIQSLAAAMQAELDNLKA